MVKNNREVDVPRWGVLGIDGALITPDDGATTATFNSRTVFRGSSRQLPRTRAVRRGARTDRRGQDRAVPWSGVIPATITVNATTDEWADVQAYDSGDSGTFYLKSRKNGAAKILWKESGTGDDKRCLLLLTGCLPNPTALFGVKVTQVGGAAVALPPPAPSRTT